MAKYQRIVTTEAGLRLLAAAVAGGTITFTSIKAGSGIYTGTETLSTMTDLKNVIQTFGVSSITRTGTQVKVRSVFHNENLSEGYSMTEIGLYARDSSGTEILYAIIVADDGLEDYLPAYEEIPTSITMELYFTLTEAEGNVAFTAEIIAGTYVPVEDFTEHVSNSGIHFTAAERTKLAGIAAGANAYTHPTSGVTAGTYRSVTVNAQGHVTAGSNPTLGVDAGGTGATDAATARTNLGVAYGTAAGTVCQGNDSRLSNARTPTAHNQAASTITAGTLAGEVRANATAAATLTNYQVRDIAISTTDLVAGTSALATGSLYIVYE